MSSTPLGQCSTTSAARARERGTCAGRRDIEHVGGNAERAERGGTGLEALALLLGTEVEPAGLAQDGVCFARQGGDPANGPTARRCRNGSNSTRHAGRRSFPRRAPGSGSRSRISRARRQRAPAPPPWPRPRSRHHDDRPRRIHRHTPPLGPGAASRSRSPPADRQQPIADSRSPTLPPRGPSARAQSFEQLICRRDRGRAPRCRESGDRGPARHPRSA